MVPRVELRRPQARDLVTPRACAINGRQIVKSQGIRIESPYLSGRDCNGRAARCLAHNPATAILAISKCDLEANRSEREGRVIGNGAIQNKIGKAVTRLLQVHVFKFQIGQLDGRSRDVLLGGPLSPTFLGAFIWRNRSATKCHRRL